MDEAVPLVFFDLETTGVDDKARIIEFASTQLKGDTLVEGEVFSTLINPEVEINNTKYHGIKTEYVFDKPTFARVASTIYRIMHKKIWVGHNIRKFDTRLLRQDFTRIGKPAPEPVGIIDTLDLAEKYMRGRMGVLNCKLESLCFHYEVLKPGEKQLHRALADVQHNIKFARQMWAHLFLESAFDFVQPIYHKQIPPTPPRVKQPGEDDPEEKVMEMALKDSLKVSDAVEPKPKLHTTLRHICTADTKIKEPGTNHYRRCRKPSINEDIGLCTIHAGLLVKKQAMEKSKAAAAASASPSAT